MMTKDERAHRDLAQRIIQASDPMPNPDQHMNWLLGLRLEALTDRLKIIESQRPWDHGTRKEQPCLSLT